MVEDLAGTAEELVQAVQLEAAGVVVAWTGVVATVVELAQAAQALSEATAAAEAAPAKTAAATNDFILIVGFVWVLLNE